MKKKNAMNIYKEMIVLLAILAVPLAACETNNDDLTLEGETEMDTTRFGADSPDTDTTGGTFSQWDQNADGALDGTEFGSAGHFDEWDADGDNQLTSAEYRQGVQDAGLFNDWDSDGDGYLSESDFRFENQNWFSEWDEDGDGQLSETEFHSGSLETWDEDSDGNVSEDEFLTMWDLDESGRIEEQEYSDARGWL